MIFVSNQVEFESQCIKNNSRKFEVVKITESFTIFEVFQIFIFEKEIREYLCALDVMLIMSHRNFTIGKLFSYKHYQSLLHSSGVVYQLTRSCGLNYIGQAKRNLITRLNEHQTCEDSEICQHLLNNPNHGN